jgi:hypothetical protein
MVVQGVRKAMATILQTDVPQTMCLLAYVEGMMVTTNNTVDLCNAPT